MTAIGMDEPSDINTVCGLQVALMTIGHLKPYGYGAMSMWASTPLFFVGGSSREQRVSSNRCASVHFYETSVDGIL